uniref:hypothetical protein n=1 Tax=Candidatus Fimivicinus sp. TaxID=3056640 RepID=UPI003FEEBEA9
MGCRKTFSKEQDRKKPPAPRLGAGGSTCQKGISFMWKCTRTISKISPLRLPFLIALTTEEEIGTRLGRAGPSFSVRPEKEA